jgi:hypothetical protein
MVVFIGEGARLEWTAREFVGWMRMRMSLKSHAIRFDLGTVFCGFGIFGEVSGK